ncbi:MAG: hypothetical protein Q8K65_08755 [Alphaproteobacteria bacterium]|nr:hypothetical protein [Alphaproteobacteria bacterium]
MKQRAFIKAGDVIIPIAAVERVDIARIEQDGTVDIVHSGGQRMTARDFDAFEAVMLLHPAALEGRRLRWVKNAWAFHNLVAHPLMQVMVWLGFKRAAIRLHDMTVPKPLGLRVSRPS